MTSKRVRFFKKMQISTNTFYKTHVTYLICSLYVLSENHNFFKKFTVKNDIYLDVKNGDHFYVDKEKFNEFHKVINQPSLRRNAFRLIKPILNEIFRDQYDEIHPKTW